MSDGAPARPGEKDAGERPVAKPVPAVPATPDAPLLHIVLVHPEIPPNTGNVIRLAANTGCALHLIEPLGFEMDDARLRRAGLDYHEYASVHRHASWSTFIAAERPANERLFALTTRGERLLASIAFERGDWLVFGSETAGLPDAVRQQIARSQWLRLPLRAQQRSLNLSNAVAVTVFEAWRQLGYVGGV